MTAAQLMPETETPETHDRVADYALVREASTALEWDVRVPRVPQQMLEALFDVA